MNSLISAFGKGAGRGDHSARHVFTNGACGRWRGEEISYAGHFSFVCSWDSCVAKCCGKGQRQGWVKPHQVSGTKFWLALVESIIIKVLSCCYCILL